jgi:hypothetical protein
MNGVSDLRKELEYFNRADNSGAVAIRTALELPERFNAAEVVEKDRLASALGSTYGGVDADLDTARKDAKTQSIAKNPVAEKWVKDAPENVAFFDSDQQALDDMYTVLSDMGALDEHDIDRESLVRSAGGDTIVNAWKRGQLQMRFAELGTQVERGEYKNIETVRAELLKVSEQLKSLRSSGDTFGAYAAIEQLPRMLGKDVPTQLKWAGYGMLGGAAFGAIVPVPGGAAAGALLGAQAGAAAGGISGVVASAQESETGAFIAEMLLQKDDTGAYYDVAEVVDKAKFYGTASAMIEGLGETALFKLLGPVASTIKARIGAQGIKAFAKDAVKDAMKNKAFTPIVRDFVSGAATAGAIEGVQEGVQEAINISTENWLKSSLEEAGLNYWIGSPESIVSRDNLMRIGDAAWTAAKTGPWFYLLPGVTKAYFDTRAAIDARRFEEGSKRLGEVVQSSVQIAESPARLESFLQTAQVNGEVLIPADAAWEIQKSGNDIATPLGWDLDTLEEAAAVGDSIAVPYARLVARLAKNNPAGFEAVASIMREKPDAPNAVEAGELADRLAEDFDAMAEQIEEAALESYMVEGETERLRAEIDQAIRSVPHLMAQINGSADPETTFGNVVKDNLRLILARGIANSSRTGTPLSEFLDKITIQGLVKGEDGSMVTPDEAEAQEQDRILAEAEQPLWDKVWGRLDSASLKTDFPEARKELAKRHGRGLFAKKGEGVAIDELADELKRAGILTDDADSSTLVELLKEKERPNRNKGRKAVVPVMRNSDTLFQTVDASQSSLDAVRRIQAFSDEAKSIKYTVTTKKSRSGKSVFEEKHVIFENIPDTLKKDVKKILQEKGIETQPDTSIDESTVNRAIRNVEKRLASKLADIELVQSFHKKENLVFESIPVSLVRGLDAKRRIHKSKSRNGGQGSDYFVAVINGRPAYVRISNHWGDFGTNVYWDDPEARKLFPNHDWENEPHGDMYGRVGKRSQKWELLGGKTNKDGEPAQTSQAGVIWLDDYTSNLGTFDPENPNILYQIAYHGTPHDFDAFTLQAIGTGEGAQAHGWGLYFAQNREVSESYRNALSSGRIFANLGGLKYRYAGNSVWMDDRKQEEVSGKFSPISHALATLELNDFDLSSAIEEVEEELAIFEKEGGEDFEATIKSLELLRSAEIKKDTGQLFKVDIPDNDVLLDEQKTFEEQPEKVKAALVSLGITDDVSRLRDTFFAALEKRAKPGNGQAAIELSKKIFAEVEKGNRPVSLFKEMHQLFDGDISALIYRHKSIVEAETVGKIGMTGAEIYRQLVEDYGSPRAASEALNAAGIKGITYDGHTDGRCFVIFDDKAIQILDKMYQFIGERGASALDLAEEATTRMDNLNVAREMEEAGRDPAIIKYATGWERGADGKWRYEIDDSKIDVSVWVDGRETTLSDILEHDELFTAYPQLREVRVVFSDDLSDDIWGGYAASTNSLIINTEVIGLGENTLRHVLLHEVQHAIQHIEGFAVGGSTETARDLVDARDLSDMSDADIYNALMGEVEARNTARRNRLPMQTRLEHLASETEDVAREDQIFLEQGINAAMMMESQMQARANIAGSVDRMSDGRYLIQLMKGANLSTILHETSHVYFLELERMVKSGNAPEDIIRDWETLSAWLAVWDDDAKLREEYEANYKNLYGGVDFDELDDIAKLSLRNRVKHEQLARGMEAYMREGKAPSSKLADVFARFAKWLKRIYKTALDLDVELTDDVRDVFGRMLATDEEVEAVASEYNIHDESVKIMDALGLRGARRLELEGLIRGAVDKAAANLRRVRDDDRLRRRREWAKEAAGIVEFERPYAVMAAMRKTPLDRQSIVDAYGEEKANQLAKRLPGAVKSEGGENPEQLALESGYQNAGEMIAEVLAAPTKKERIKAIIDKKQAEYDASFASIEDYLFEQDELARQQELIAQALAEKIAKAADKVNRKHDDPLREQPVDPEEYSSDFGTVNRYLVEQKLMEHQASVYLNKQRAADAVNPDKYRRAAAKHLREERRAILEGKWEKALEANYKARINLELSKQSAELRDTMRKLERRSKRFLAQDLKQALKHFTEPQAKALLGARFAVLLLTQNIGLFKPTLKMLTNADGKGANDVAAFIREMGDAGFITVTENSDGSVMSPDLPGVIFKQKLGNWKEHTLADVKPYIDGLTAVMYMENSFRKGTVEVGKKTFGERMEDIAASIMGNSGRREPNAFDAKHKNKLLGLLRKFNIAHLKAETIALLMDGDVMGSVFKNIYMPLKRSEWARDERIEKEAKKVRQLFSVYSRKELVAMKGERVFVEAINASITKEQALCVLLNCGNESNMQRIMLGHGLQGDDNQKLAQIAAIIDILDEKDVRFAQSVWDYFETFRDEAFALEERITGVRPQAVQATPLATKFGMLRGGYYPISYDKELSAKPIDEEKVGTNTGGSWASVDHGMVKQRTATGLGTPVDLSLDVIPDHVARTVRMLTMRIPIMETARVLNDRRVASAIEQVYGAEVYDALLSWLKYTAGERPAKTVWSRALSWVRKNGSVYAMGYRLSTMIAQTTGLLTTTAEIGAKWTAYGVAYVAKNPMAAYRLATELSSVMRGRIKSVDRDLLEVSSAIMDTGSSNKILDPLVRIKNIVDKYAYVPVGAVQLACADLPTFWGAYHKALSEGKKGAEAVEYANIIVERTQVTGHDSALAAIQRDGELSKIMTMFYSYFSALYQLSTRRITMLQRSGWKGTHEWFRFGTLALMTWFAEPVLMGLIMPGGGPDEEEPDTEDWLAWGAREALLNPFNMVVGVRDIASMIDGMLDGYSGRVRIAPAAIIESFGRFGKQVYKAIEDEGDADEKKLILSGLKTAGPVSGGLLTSQEILTLEAIWDWLDGTNPDLELADFVRRKKN